MTVSVIGFQSHTPSKKQNILSEKKNWVKNHVFNQKTQFSGIFKKSIKDFKDETFRLSNHFWSEMQQ